MTDDEYDQAFGLPGSSDYQEWVVRCLRPVDHAGLHLALVAHAMPPLWLEWDRDVRRLRFAGHCTVVDVNDGPYDELCWLPDGHDDPHDVDYQPTRLPGPFPDEAAGLHPRVRAELATETRPEPRRALNRMDAYQDPYYCISQVLLRYGDDMATITLRVEDGTRDDLERLAQARDTSVSELLREAIANLLGTRRELVSGEAPRSMPMVDRRVLALLHEILARVDPEGETGDHARQIEALGSGFTDEYAYEFGGLAPELSLADCTLVHDVLEMFTVLESSLEKAGDEADAELGEDARFLLEFAGFDGNDSHESRLRSYAKHLIDTDRWTSLASHFDDKHERGNSHMPTLDRYQRMLPAYRSVVEKKRASHSVSVDAYRFNIDDLREVLAAAQARWAQGALGCRGK